MILLPKTLNTTELCTTTLTTMEQLIFLCWQRMETPSQPPAPLISSKWTLANSSGTIITVANDGFWLFSMNIAFSQHSHNNWGYIYHIPLGQAYQSFSSHQKVKQTIQYEKVFTVTKGDWWVKLIFSRESDSTIANVCSFVVIKQNPSTAWNHHPSSFIFHHSSFILYHFSFILHHSSFILPSFCDF